MRPSIWIPLRLSAFRAIFHLSFDYREDHEGVLTVEKIGPRRGCPLDHDSEPYNPTRPGLRRLPQPMTLLTATFYYMAAASIASALLAVTRRNPVHSRLCVLALFLPLAGLSLLLGV